MPGAAFERSAEKTGPFETGFLPGIACDERSAVTRHSCMVSPEMRWSWLLVFLVGATGAPAQTPPNAAELRVLCRSIPQCVSELRRVAVSIASDALEIDPQEAQRILSSPTGAVATGTARDLKARAVRQLLTASFEALGPAAIDALVDLLKDPDKDVRMLAAECVNRLARIEARQLSALIAASKTGTVWLDWAISSVPGRESADFLIGGLLRRDSLNPVRDGFYVARTGAAAAPGLAALFRCGAACRSDVLDTACEALTRLKSDAGAAVPILLQVLEDRMTAPRTVLKTVTCLGRLGAVSERAASRLAALSRSGPAETREAAREALLGIGGEEAAVVIAAQLENAEDGTEILERIGDLGTRGLFLGPTVAAYLRSDDLEEQTAAARAVGKIGYSPAATDLAGILSEEDPFLPLAAAKSLGLLKAADARAALERAAVEHWYPPVREAARASLDALSLDATNAPQPQPAQRFETTAAVDRKPCATADQFPAVKGGGPTFTNALADSMTYIVTEERYDDSLNLTVKPREERPEVGLRLTHGWLLGADRGEWGGELVYRPDSGAIQVVTEANIQGIFAFANNRIVAVSGLGHIDVNWGAVLEVKCTADGACEASPWRRLPAHPRDAWMSESGLIINTSGGSVVIDQNGRMSMAPCHKNAAPKSN